MLETVSILQGHAGDVLAMAFSAAGNMLASASRDRTVRLWSPDDGKEGYVLSGHRGAIRDLAFSPDGNRLISGSADMTAKTWDTSDGQLMQSLDAHAGAVDAVTWLPDGGMVACGWNMWSYGHVTLWNAISGQQIMTHRTQHGQLIFGLDSSSDYLVAALAAGFIHVWDTDQNGMRIRAHGETTRQVRFNVSGDMLASVSSGGEVKVWRLPDDQPEMKLTDSIRAIYDLAWSGDGRLLAAGGKQGELAIWDMEQGRRLISHKLHQPVQALVWSGEYLAVGLGNEIHLKRMDND